MLSLDRLLELAGDIQTDSEACQRFREILKEDAEVDDLEQLLEEAVQGNQNHHNLALQDIVNEIGRRLGFKIEHGVYSGKTDSTIGYDGHWVLRDYEDGEDTHLVVETKKNARFLNPLKQPGEYMHELSDKEEVNKENVYGLCVTGPRSEAKQAARTIRGSKYRDKIRVISTKDLMDLLCLIKRSGLPPREGCELLLPRDTVDVGSLVRLVERMTVSDSDEQRSRFWGLVEERIGMEEKGDHLQFNERLSGAENLRAFVSLLHSEGYLSDANVPYSLSESRYLVNWEPVHPEGDTMFSPKKASGDLWVETNMKNSTKKELMRQLVEDVVVGDETAIGADE